MNFLGVYSIHHIGNRFGAVPMCFFVSQCGPLRVTANTLKFTPFVPWRKICQISMGGCFLPLLSSRRQHDWGPEYLIAVGGD